MGPANVRFGSKADIAACSHDVRFIPESGHEREALQCPLSANSELDAPQQTASLFDHRVGAQQDIRWYRQAERLRGLGIYK